MENIKADCCLVCTAILGYGTVVEIHDGLGLGLGLAILGYRTAVEILDGKYQS